MANTIILMLNTYVGVIVGIRKLKLHSGRLAHLSLALLFVATSLVPLLRLEPAFAASMVTKTYDTDTQLNTGAFDLTSVNGTGTGAYASLCHGGPACDQYYRPITIDNTSGPAMNSPLVHITVNTAALITAGKLQSDCGDIRFMDSDQTTELTNGKVDNCNSTTSDVELILPSISANSTRTIYMYYGALSPATPLHGGRVNLDNSMATNPSPPATLQGDAVWDSADGYVQLTDAIGDESGALEYTNNPGDNFDFSTDFQTGGGSGADGIYLYMGTDSTPQTENDAVGGYIFAYDEFQDYIGIQYNGQALAVDYCSTPSSITEIDISAAQQQQSDAACDLDNADWRTARVVRTDDNIKMYLDGNLIIDYTSGSLPEANGPLMGWGARTGGSTNYHRIRNLTLDVGESDTVDATSVTVGSESSAASNFPSDGSWATPIVDMQSIAAWGDNDPDTVALSGAVSNLDSGDTATLEMKQANTTSGIAGATPVTLETLDDSGDGTFSYTVGDLSGYSPSNYGSVVQFIIAIHRGSATSPHLENLAFSYTPEYFGPPSAPINVVAASAGGRNANITWDPPTDTHHSDVQYYVVEYKAANASWDDELGSININAPATQATGIQLGGLGQDYVFRVSAYNDYGLSDFSDEVAFTTPTPVTRHITDCQQLQDIGSDDSTWGDHFVLDNDIDCTETSDWNSGAGFLPIAPDDGDPFYGSLDGQGHTIKNLYINGSDWEMGLFGNTDYASISNLNFDGGSVTSTSGDIGVLIGFAQDDTTITNVTSNVPVTGTSQLGGLVGQTDSDNYNTVTITNSSTSGDVTSTGSNCDIGGIIGEASAYQSLTVTNVHSSSNVSGYCSVGGLFGYADGVPNISNSYATGNIASSSGEYIGGLVGEMEYDGDDTTTATVTNSYATGNVTMDTYGYAVGGLVGYLEGEDGLLTFNKVYATGNVTVTDNDSGYYIGDMFGYDYDTPITNAYTTGNVSAPNSDYIGGFTGYQDKQGMPMTNVYASGNVEGEYAVGGLIGTGMAHVTNSFASGTVTGSDAPTTAGLIGYAMICTQAELNNNYCADGTVLANDYYDQTATTQSSCVDAYDFESNTTDTPDGCTPITQTGYFVNKTTGPLFGTWDFTDVWIPHIAIAPTFTTISEAVVPTTSSSTTSSSAPKPKAKKKVIVATTSDTAEASDAATTTSGDYIYLNIFKDYLNNTDPGHELSLSVGQVVHFDIGSTHHTATVTTVGDNYVVLTIASTPFNVTVELGQTLFVDVNKDGQDDISVHLNSISGDVADLTFKQLHYAAKVTHTSTATPGHHNWWWLLLIPVLLWLLWLLARKKKQQADNAPQ